MTDSIEKKCAVNAIKALTNDAIKGLFPFEDEEVQFQITKTAACFVTAAVAKVSKEKLLKKLENNDIITPEEIEEFYDEVIEPAGEALEICRNDVMARTRAMLLILKQRMGIKDDED